MTDNQVSNKRFSKEVLRRIAEIVAEVRTGREMIELFEPYHPSVRSILGSVYLIETKKDWKEFLHGEAYEPIISLVSRVVIDIYEREDGFSNIIGIIEKISDPKGYIGNPEKCAKTGNDLNKALIYDGLKIGGDYKVIQVSPGVEQGEKTPLHMKLFEELSLHPVIEQASKDLFNNGHYAQAIFEAYKALNNLVKRKSRQTELDGKNLMAHVFSENNPVLKLNRLRTPTEKDEQEGFRFLYMGAMVGIRNPKAHDNVVQEDPLRTLKYLAFVSLLAERLEEADVVS